MTHQLGLFDEEPDTLRGTVSQVRPGFWWAELEGVLGTGSSEKAAIAAATRAYFDNRDGYFAEREKVM